MQTLLNHLSQLHIRLLSLEAGKYHIDNVGENFVTLHDDTKTYVARLEQKDKDSTRYSVETETIPRNSSHKTIQQAKKRLIFKQNEKKQIAEMRAQILELKQKQEQRHLHTELLWKSAAKTSILRSIIAQRKRLLAASPQALETRLWRKEIKIADMDLRERTQEFERLLYSDPQFIDTKILSEFNEYNLLVEELVQEREHWATRNKKKESLYNDAIRKTDKREEYEQLEQNTLNEITRLAQDALQKEDDDAAAEQEMKMQKEKAEQDKKETQRVLAENALTQDQILTNMADIFAQTEALKQKNKELLTAIVKEFEQINELSRELLADYEYWKPRNKPKKLEEYKKAILTEKTYWRKRKDDLQQNDVLNNETKDKINKQIQKQQDIFTTHESQLSTQWQMPCDWLRLRLVY